jgi:long-chain acyl-CoA synthetase
MSAKRAKLPTASPYSCRPWLNHNDFRVPAEINRKKGLIVGSGFNVYPNEVEDMPFARPAVKDVAVIGLPCAYRGEAVKAFVVLNPYMLAAVEELIEPCSAPAARYKAPSFIEFVEGLLKSAIGKVLRRELHDAEASGRTAL